ncbi:unnamed protein product [Acanthoscelides obtectus]|uniref:Uncharacterized protein n=1 Tax=Acanthoscelides obtectus TaxID=200917 RepID=A0A9P0L4R1_ACAOB|nr:unnamed protein product [Acanthoscelides obtectus]CAK1627819.1 hypothetical protein AOBTE_LOCUS4835 [Acanthoscelides obtectus]
MCKTYSQRGSLNVLLMFSSSNTQEPEKISQSPLESYDSKYHVKIVSNLKDNFKNRFKDFNETAIVAKFGVSPFMEIDIQQFATSVTQNLSEDIAATEMELVDLAHAADYFVTEGNDERCQCVEVLLMRLELVSVPNRQILHLYFPFLRHHQYQLPKI